ncbi:hypothetical protein MHYP_G00247450 [Metynnis hypsauchen]
MDKEMFMDNANSWVAPLPFRTPRERLPHSRDQALMRLASVQRTLEKRPEMKKHFVTFMQNTFDRDHAEQAPPLPAGKECWYLPIFGVYHPQKPGQIRVVFDSSAKSHGVSLNDVLLSGPDLNNSLVGVLLRFRRVFATSTDIVKDMGRPVAMLLRSYGSIEGKYSMKVQNAVSKGLIQMSYMKKHRHWNLRTQRNLVPKRLSDICFNHHKGSDDVSEKIPTVPPLLLSTPVFSSHSALKKSLEGAHGPKGSLQHNGISEQV